MAQIRRHILRLGTGKPFTTRDLLNYGTRAAVDQATSRLVKDGEIMRLARGVFFAPALGRQKVFTAFEIARIKAESFGKRIITYAGRAAERLGLTYESERKLIFSINGSSSSFKFGEAIIHFRKTSARKMHLADGKAGLVIRSLWHLGKLACTRQMISKACQSLDRQGRFEIKQRAAFMPYWLSNIFMRPWISHLPMTGNDVA